MALMLNETPEQQFKRMMDEQNNLIQSNITGYDELEQGGRNPVYKQGFDPSKLPPIVHPREKAMQDAIGRIKSQGLGAFQAFDYFKGGSASPTKGYYLPVYTPSNPNAAANAATMHINTRWGQKNYQQGQANPLTEPDAPGSGFMGNQSITIPNPNQPGHPLSLQTVTYPDGSVWIQSLPFRPIDLPGQGAQPTPPVDFGTLTRGHGPIMYQGEKAPVKVGTATVFEDRYDPDSPAAAFAKQLGHIIPGVAPVGQPTSFADALKSVARQTGRTLPVQQPTSEWNELMARFQKDQSGFGYTKPGGTPVFSTPSPNVAGQPQATPPAAPAPQTAPAVPRAPAGTAPGAPPVGTPQNPHRPSVIRDNNAGVPGATKWTPSPASSPPPNSGLAAPNQQNAYLAPGGQWNPTTGAPVVPIGGIRPDPPASGGPAPVSSAGGVATAPRPTLLAAPPVQPTATTVQANPPAYVPPAPAAAPSVTKLSGNNPLNFREYMLSSLYPQFAPMDQGQMGNLAAQQAALQTDPAVAALRRELDTEGLQARQQIEGLTGASFQRLLDLNRKREQETKERATGTQNAMGRLFSPLGRGEIEREVRPFRENEGTLLAQQAEQAGRIGEQFNLRQQQLRTQIGELEARRGQIQATAQEALRQSERAAAAGDLQSALQFAQQAQQLRQQAAQMDNQNALAMAELKESQRKTDISASLQGRDIDLRGELGRSELGLKRDSLTQDESQFGRKLAEETRQFDAGTGLRAAQQKGVELANKAENNRQYITDQFRAKWGYAPEEAEMRLKQAQTAKTQFDLDLANGKITDGFAARLKQAELDQTIAQTGQAKAAADLATSQARYYDRRPGSEGEGGMTAAQKDAAVERINDNVTSILTSPNLDGNTKINRLNAQVQRYMDVKKVSREKAIADLNLGSFEKDLAGAKAPGDKTDAATGPEARKFISDVIAEWAKVSRDNPLPPPPGRDVQEILAARRQAQAILSDQMRSNLGMDWATFVKRYLQNSDTRTEWNKYEGPPDLDPKPYIPPEPYPGFDPYYIPPFAP